MLKLREGGGQGTCPRSHGQEVVRVDSGWVGSLVDMLTLCMRCSQEFGNLKTFKRIESEVLRRILGSGFNLGENSQKAPLKAIYSRLFSRDIFGYRQMY